MSNRIIKADLLKSSDNSKTFTPPSASDTLVGRNSTDTLTNKTIDAADNTIVGVVASVAVPAIFRDEKSGGTNAGSSTADTWVTRTLNTFPTSADATWASLSSNQITLDSGTYLVQFAVPAFFAAGHQAKLYNVTDTADELIGTSGFADNTSASWGCNSHSHITGVIVVPPATTKTYEIQHNTQLNVSGAGYGQAANRGVSEVYTSGVILKIS